MVRLLTTVAAVRCYLDKYRAPLRQTQGVTQQVGLVPTMGALHEGHLSLIRRSRLENQIVVVSIFVNPLQFGPREDFQEYPRDLERDRQLCEELGVDVIFAPTSEQMYGAIAWENPEATTRVFPPKSMTQVLCGRTRIGHFEGVATVVTKLLQIIQPQRAYFGQKDGQQLAIIRQVVADLQLPTEIVSCAIVREDSGLALSSRNQYLQPYQREKAALLYRSLCQAAQEFERQRQASNHHGPDAHTIIDTVRSLLAAEPEIQVEYVELVHPDTLVPLERVENRGMLALAAWVGSVRLIDNILLENHRRPIVAIDGPAGAGKSTVARQVAERLNLLYLDTGAMYRAVTWSVLDAGVAMDDEPAVAEVASQCRIDLIPHGDRVEVQVNGRDVTPAIRNNEVTNAVSTVAAQPAVRQILVQQQQRYGERGGLVAEGRDIGTNVFPEAELKIFLTASVKERARRRQQDMQQQGENQIDLEMLEQAIAKRDQQDSDRMVAPLCQAADAIEIQTDGLTVEQVVEQILACYQEVLVAVS
jgi:pantoate ligase/cytidylate kinase